MHEGRDDSTAAEAGNLTIFERRVHRKFTLTTDCDGLLKLAKDRPGTYISKSADEIISYYKLDALMTVDALDLIKVKCFHSCEHMEIHQDACLKALWSIGDWLAERYRVLGKAVHCEHLTDGHGTDWAEPDAKLIVTIMQNSGDGEYDTEDGDGRSM